MKYNLFLDDIRVPYLTDIELKQISNRSKYMSSAYYYTKYEPFKTEKWEIVRTYDEFVDFIKKYGCPSIVAFDHDLADEHYNYLLNKNTYKEKTGYDAAKWLCEYCQDNNIKFPKYFVHSMNIIGSENIINYIENYKKNIEK